MRAPREKTSRYLTDFKCLRLTLARSTCSHRNFLFAAEAEITNQRAEPKITRIAITANSNIGIPDWPLQKSTP